MQEDHLPTPEHADIPQEHQPTELQPNEIKDTNLQETESIEEIESNTEDHPLVEVETFPVEFAVDTKTHPRMEKPLAVQVKQAKLLGSSPWVRPLGTLQLTAQTQAWKFPTLSEGGGGSPPAETPDTIELFSPDDCVEPTTGEPKSNDKPKTRLRPPADMVHFKDRLLYLLQPPLEDLFNGKVVTLPFKPYPYQVKGIAFLIPRAHALIADEMGLGKTAQVIIALRLMFHNGMINNALVVCPKPLVINWTRELRLWAEDIPFEVITGDSAMRKYLWYESKCPLKLVNYEILTRDAEWVCDEALEFDVVALDEAQRIKNKESKTAKVVRDIRRKRSWAMSGTPIENRTEDLINLFAFVDRDRIPPDTPTKLLPQLIQDCIIRRVKEDVVEDMPPRIIRDTFMELDPAQREAYELAEKEGVVYLNDLGDTITLQHVFELVMRLKQICNFEPRTGASAKLEQIRADMEEVAANDRKAIIFSQYVDPLERIAKELEPYGPLLYHGKIPHRDRQPILDQFKNDPTKHVILMSYGTGSVGLNLQFTNYVFLFDRWWNPAIEDQAINRAHRLGQKEPVFVTRFISENTIEGRIHEILENKRALFNSVIANNGLPTSMGMTEDDIFGLFDVQARPKKKAA